MARCPGPVKSVVDDGSKVGEDTEEKVAEEEPGSDHKVPSESAVEEPMLEQMVAAIGQEQQAASPEKRKLDDDDDPNLDRAKRLKEGT